MWRERGRVRLLRAKTKTLSRLKTVTISLVWRENRIINGKRRCVCVGRGGRWGEMQGVGVGGGDGDHNNFLRKQLI